MQTECSNSQQTKNDHAIFYDMNVCCSRRLFCLGNVPCKSDSAESMAYVSLVESGNYLIKSYLCFAPLCMTSIIFAATCNVRIQLQYRLLQLINKFSQNEVRTLHISSRSMAQHVLMSRTQHNSQEASIYKSRGWPRKSKFPFVTGLLQDTIYHVIPFSIIIKANAVTGWMPVSGRTERCTFLECWLQRRYLRFLVLPKISSMTFTFTVTVNTRQITHSSYVNVALVCY